MYHDERSDAYWAATNPGGNALPNGGVFPIRQPLPSPLTIPATQGVQAANDGLVKMGVDGATSAKRLILVPIGQGAPGQQFQMQILGWRATSGNLFANTVAGMDPRLWIPIVLAQYTVTLGNLTGTPNKELGPNTFFATTISQTVGPTQFSGSTSEDWFTITPPGNSSIASISVRGLGYRYLEAIFNVTTAASANCLYTKW